MKVEHKGFTVSRDGLKMHGDMFKPVGEGPFPAIIVSHEFMMNRITTWHLAKLYAKMGYAAFCYDFNGGGAISQSQGKTTQMSVVTEVEDLLAVIDYVESLPYTDNNNLNLHGCSQGGFVSALTAAKIPEKIQKLVLYYPALCVPDDARGGQMIMAKFDPQNVPKILFGGPIILGARYVTDVLDWDAFDMIDKYTGKVLLIHGTADHIVDYQYSVKANEAYKAAGADIKFVTVKGGEHLLPLNRHKAWKNAKKFMAL